MKKILIIGAGFLQSFVIEKTKKMGYYTLAVDADPNAVGFQYADKHAVVNIVDEKACLEFAKQEKIDGVLTAATDYGVLTAAYIAQEMGLPGLHYKVAQLVKNKYEVRKCLYEHRVDDTKQTYEVNSHTNLEELQAKLSYPVMVKPCDGSGSRGASRVNSAKELAQACQFAMDGSITHRAEIETFIFGQEYGAESLVANGEIHVLGIMKKEMTNPPYFAELGHSMPCGLPSELEKKAISCVKKAIEALGINFGSVNMDLLITKEGSVHIVDIGARMGGNMIGPCVIPYGTGIDYMGNMIRNAVGDPLDWSTSPHLAVATKLFAFPNGTVQQLPDFQQWMQDNNVEIYHHLHVGDMIHEYHTNLDGCGYIIAKREDVSEAKQVATDVLTKTTETIF